MKSGFIALVGRPNVGKSTIFNKMVGKKLSIIEDTPGVTRDRVYGSVNYGDYKFHLIDTGGIEPESKDVILSQMREQAQIAIDTADVIVFMCDVRTGLTADDRDIATMLKKSGKPIVPCINKCDSVGHVPFEFYEFYELGFEQDPIPVSSVHGTGTGDILDAVLEALPEGFDADEDEEDWDEDEDYEEGFDFGDDDSTIYEVECACGEIIDFDEEVLEKGSMTCPNCGETLEFSLEDDE